MNLYRTKHSVSKPLNISWWLVKQKSKTVPVLSLLHNQALWRRSVSPRCRTTSTIWLEETRRSSKNHLAENDWGGPTVTEFRAPHGMEEGKGERYFASGRQYGNALLVRHQEEEKQWVVARKHCGVKTTVGHRCIRSGNGQKLIYILLLTWKSVHQRFTNCSSVLTSISCRQRSTISFERTFDL